jgi:hypothetical protein
MTMAPATPPTPPGPTGHRDVDGAPARASPGLLLMLLQAAWARPQGLGSHLTRYVRLLQRLRAPSQAALQQQARWTMLAWGCLLLAAGLGGVGLMLWVMLWVMLPMVSPIAAPAPTSPRAWVLLAVPLLPLVVSAWAFGAARRVPPPPLWAAWAAQWRADLAVLQPPARAPAAAEAPSAPTGLDLLRAGAQQGGDALLRPLARQHPWALLGGAALAGALLVGGRPWRSLLRPSLLASLGVQWALQAWVESWLAAPAASDRSTAPSPALSSAPSASAQPPVSNGRVMPTAAPRPATHPPP